MANNNTNNGKYPAAVRWHSLSAVIGQAVETPTPDPEESQRHLVRSGMAFAFRSKAPVGPGRSTPPAERGELPEVTRKCTAGQLMGWMLVTLDTLGPVLDPRPARPRGSNSFRAGASSAWTSHAILVGIAFHASRKESETWITYRTPH